MTRNTGLNVPIATAALLAVGIWPALANPAGSSIVSGNAAVSGEGSASVTVNQATDKAIINWRTFDVGHGEATTFVQPGADSVTLNRVTGGLGASAIDGTLKANGRVFIINRDGILFGPQSIVDVGGLVATTHDIANDDFMAGRYVFSQPGNAGASIVNAGTITANNGGFAALVAPGVRNAGVISARLGKVGLAAGNGFTLDFYGDQLLTLSLSDEIAADVQDVQTGEKLDALVKNEGALRADGGTVQLTAAAARRVVDSVINNTGVIEANSVGLKNGKIVLGAATAATKPANAPAQKIKVAGRLSAAGKKSGETGGKVQITGEEITLVGAAIDASGDAGGGTVLIGGDVGGGKPNQNVVPLEKARPEATPVPTATTVRADATTVIDASATGAGNGGKVIAWADYATTFPGTIRARGGASSGDGGFVEVSAKERLEFTGMIAEIAAPWGLAGTVLFDPVTTAAITTANVSTVTNTLNQGGTAIVYGGSVSIQTNIFKTAGGTATLKVFGDDGITINSGVTIGSSKGALNILLDADADINSHFNTRGVLGTLPFADNQYPGSAGATEQSETYFAYHSALASAFVAYVGGGKVSLPSILTASLTGKNAYDALGQFITDANGVANSKLSASGTKYYTNGGTFSLLENRYKITSDAKGALTTPTSTLNSTMSAIAASNSPWQVGLFVALQNGGTTDLYYRFNSFQRTAANTPSGFNPGSMAPSPPPNFQTLDGREIYVPPPDPKAIAAALAKSNIDPTATSTTVKIGQSTFISTYETFPNFKQTDPSNTALYSSYAWAVTVDPTTGQPRYKETCLAVVYAMIEQSRGNKGYRVGNPGTWTDEKGASGISGVGSETGVDFAAVKKNIDIGNPVILHASDHEAGHFVLAIGYDALGNIIANDPWTGNQVSISSTTWKESGGGAGAAYTFNGGMRLVTL